VAEQTNIALELAHLCDRLSFDSGHGGDAVLAKLFGVEAWSAEFFQIIFSIVARTHALETQLTSTIKSEAVVSGAKHHLSQIRQAFGKNALNSAWRSHGMQLVGAMHSSPVRMVSAALPENLSYPKLSTEERVELSEMVDELLGWLREKQLSDRDFIRESLIEGLELFKFRLDRMEWFGWGYSIETLQQVFLAYYALEKGLDPVANPDAGAVLKKLEAVFKKVLSYTTTTKDAADKAGWLLSCYKYVVSAAPTGGAYIAGLLT
jgi:hypothetical protein